MPPKKKQKRNITGLRNQTALAIAEPLTEPVGEPDASGDNEGLGAGLHFDSTRVNWEQEDEESDDDELDVDDFDDGEFAIQLVEMVEKQDARIWIGCQQGCASSMNKAQSTAYRHAGKFKDQNLLDSFGFKSSRAVTAALPIMLKKLPSAWKAAINPTSSTSDPWDLSLDEEEPEAEANPETRSPSPIIMDKPLSPTIPHFRTPSPIIRDEPLSPMIPAIRRASQSPELWDHDLPVDLEPVSSTAPSDNDGDEQDLSMEEEMEEQ
ncbi:hypothetical protein C8J56DRAFT_890079 [Mycena floridula]|nr:hypothetical protein C8J56DRAFT_890079 [Mycena floridula]